MASDDEDQFEYEDSTAVETIEAKKAASQRPEAMKEEPADTEKKPADSDSDEVEEPTREAKPAAGAADDPDSDDDAEAEDGSDDGQEPEESDGPIATGSTSGRRPATRSQQEKKGSNPYRGKQDPGHHDHGFAHILPVKLLVTVLGALLVLTFLTVAVTRFDLGGQGNLVVAMVIATLKASLVVAYFMHLRWDKKFHLLVFLSSVLFFILFLGLTLTDRREYQPLIDQKDTLTNAPTAPAPGS